MVRAKRFHYQACHKRARDQLIRCYSRLRFHIDSPIHSSTDNESTTVHDPRPTTQYRFRSSCHFLNDDQTHGTHSLNRVRPWNSSSITSYSRMCRRLPSDRLSAYGTSQTHAHRRPCALRITLVRSQYSIVDHLYRSISTIIHD